MRYPREELDAYRKSTGELENELIDDYNDGNITRRELLRRGSVLGMSIPLLGLVAGVPLADGGAAGGGAPRGHAPGRLAGHRRLARAAAPPVARRAGVSHMAGEQLVFADKNSRLVPRIATSWKSSNRAKTWTFQIRRNVKFHDGTPVDRRRRRRDVQAAPDEGLAGAVVLQGRDRRRQARPGTHTVVFDLAASNGFFPYALSQQTYQAIILPKTYKLPADLTKPGDWTSKMNGTGPFS